MAEDPIRPDEEEYHFSEKPSANIFGGQTEMDEEDRQRGIRRMAFIGLGIIVVVLVLYKSLGIFFGPKQPSHVAPQVTQTSLPAPTPVATPTPVVAVPADLQTRLNDMDQKSSDTQNAVQTLTGDVSSMKTTLADLQSQMSQLNDSVKTLTQSLATSEAQLQALTAPKVKPQKVHRHYERPIPVWYLQATVPGRAWLTGPRGETLTISIGDSLRGYGKIVNIDVMQGIVTTSSGKHIGYSPKDR